ncbi:hypothetical protein EON80_12400 [bacterium]|nr:MAG: hypothetical protein EON80_12400 [bacterium]
MSKLLFRSFYVLMASIVSAGCSPVATPPANAADGGKPSEVKLVQNGAKWQLTRDGQHYFIKGVGGDGSKTDLKALGGNSFRTWGADNLEKQLDEAEKLGLTVTIGIWLGHKEHGFDYKDEAKVAEQYENAKKAIDRYKNHPALLMWAVGNEMEIGFPDEYPEVWQAVEKIAAYAKQSDPKHPVMTVVAEIGGNKVGNINKYCPSVDIIGINSYAGGPSIVERYPKAGGTKPFVVTEFGPAGTWESKRNDWGSVAEPTSTAKGAAYKATYEKTVLGSPLSLGSYAFTWGNKQEASATWFGLLLPDGTRLEAVDDLSEFWTGKAPANRVPAIESLTLESPEKNKPGAVVKASLKTKDAENDALKVDWVLQHDPMEEGIGGATQATPPVFPDAIQNASKDGVTVTMPKFGGGYRLFAYIRDGKGGGAVGNIPLFVEGGEKLGGKAAPAKPVFTAGKAKLPLQVMTEEGMDGAYTASGYMGKAEAIKMTETTENVHSGKNALKVQFNSNDNWGGVVWQNPANDWGDKAGGWNLTGAKKLTFWARGEEGGEEVSFSYGLIGADKPHSDSAKGETGKLTLSKEWEQYSLDLKGKNLAQIKTGFCWVIAADGKPVTFYLDDIRYE